MRYAVLENDEVVNLIMWNSEDEYEPAEHCMVIPVTEEVAIGWKRDGDSWIVPVEPEPELPPLEDPVVTEARHQAVRELTALGVSEATARVIAGLPPL